MKLISFFQYLPRLAAVLLLGAGLALPPAVVAQPSTEAPAKIFTVVTSERVETQFMALVLSLQSARKGAEVRILLCDAAGELAIRDKTFAPLLPANRSPRDSLESLLEAGVKVEICAVFLPNRPYTSEDLLPGITTARPDAVAEYMVQPDVRFFTF
jgi:predicted peroxiredoxin